MMNLIRADIYRILRGKGLYITFGVMIALLLLVIGANTTMINQQVEETILETAIEHGLASGIQALQASMNNLMYIQLSLLVITAAAMFTHSTIKNDIASGVYRTRLYVSKLIISCVLCVLAYIFYIGIGMLMIIWFDGVAGPLPDGFWIDSLKIFASQLLILLAVNCIGIFLVFTAKRSSVVIGVFIAIFMVPAMIVAMLSFLNPNLSVFLAYFDLATRIDRLRFFHQIEESEIIKILSVAGGYILVSCISGIALFKRAEIK